MGREDRLSSGPPEATDSTPVDNETPTHRRSSFADRLEEPEVIVRRELSRLDAGIHVERSLDAFYGTSKIDHAERSFAIRNVVTPAT